MVEPVVIDSASSQIPGHMFNFRSRSPKVGFFWHVDFHRTILAAFATFFARVVFVTAVTVTVVFVHGLKGSTIIVVDDDAVIVNILMAIVAMVKVTMYRMMMMMLRMMMMYRMMTNRSARHNFVS